MAKWQAKSTYCILYPRDIHQLLYVPFYHQNGCGKHTDIIIRVLHTHMYIYIYTHVYITNPFMATCFVNYLIPISLAQMPQFLWVSLISLRMEMTPMMGSNRLPSNVTIHEPCFPTWITISHVCLVTYPGYIVLGCRGVVPPESFFFARKYVLGILR